VIVVPEYRGHRIEVKAVEVEGRWNADVRIRRTLSSTTPHVETVTCLKLRADHAERSGELWAKRWVDFEAEERKP